MYGILMESVRKCIIDDYGETKWEEITRLSQVPESFCMHENYDDQTMVQLAEGCSMVLGKSEESVMFYYGLCFVKFCQSHGYYKILSGMGRTFHDFLHGIDDLHENMRYSYPNMCSPLFKVESEDENGCVLRYESQRTGFTYYVMGQLTGIATSFYGIPSSELTITVLKNEQEEQQGSRVHYRLDFHNTGFHNKRRAAQETDDIAREFGKVPAEVFLKLFPFCIVFDKDLTVRIVGASLARMFPHKSMVMENLKKFFMLRRPQVTFSWDNLINLQKVVHELASTEALLEGCPFSRPLSELVQSAVILRGEMKYVEDWGCIAFLCKPLAGKLTDVKDMGLYLSDYSLCDRGQEIALSNTTHSSTIEARCAEHRKLAEEIQKVLDLTMQHHAKSDELLNSMMPKDFAMRLKRGEKSPSKKYEAVTIMFSYLVGFKEVCEQCKPDVIVKSLNRVFDHFDPIIEKHGLFKVETLGDAVTMVAGGVPEEIEDHAHRVAGLALELVQEATSLTHPITGQPHSVRIGMHTGGVVAGVVGLHTPQYCLFGDTVNTASRMQSYSEPGRIHLSAPCRECLRDSEYVIVYRGHVNIKGKGAMKTYWLAGRKGEEEAERLRETFRAERDVQKKLKLKSPESLSQFDLHSLHLASSSSTISTVFEDHQHSSEEEQEKEAREEGEEEEEDDAQDVIFGEGSTRHPPLTLQQTPAPPSSHPSPPSQHSAAPPKQSTSPPKQSAAPPSHPRATSNHTSATSNACPARLNHTLGTSNHAPPNSSHAPPNSNHAPPSSSHAPASSKHASQAPNHATSPPKQTSAPSKHASAPSKCPIAHHTAAPPSQPGGQRRTSEAKADSSSSSVQMNGGSGRTAAQQQQHPSKAKPLHASSRLKPEKRPSKPAVNGGRH